jgi:uncharacterized protein
MSAAKTPSCPICRKPAPKEGNQWFPFCSDRCKVLDLSKWINAEYRIASREEDEGDGAEVGDSDGTGLH